MAQIHFGRNSRTVERIYSSVHVISCGLAVVLAIVSLVRLDLFFCPFLFLDGALLNLICSYETLGNPWGRRNHLPSGLLRVLFGLFLLWMTVVSGICIWG